MRVLVATDQWFPDLLGGVARVATDTARLLAERGHDVTVLAPATPAGPAVERAGRLTVRRVLARSSLPQTVGDVVATRRAVAECRPGHFDVALAHASTCAAGVLAAAAIPLVWAFHASEGREARYRRTRSASRADRAATYVLAPLLDLLEGYTLRRATSVVVLSEFTRSLLREDRPDWAERAVLAPGGVDVERFQPADGPAAARARLGLEGEGELLVTVRRLEARMGLEPLLHAVALLRRRRPVRLAVVGSGSLAGRLERLRCDLGLGDAVLLAGRVPDEQLPDWYRAGDLFVLPTAAYEGFGIATAEALACGTPVVGTPVGATPELLLPLDRRLVTAAADAESLAAGIAAVLDDAAALRGPCRAYALERLDWRHAVVAWESALADAATGARAA